MCPALLKHPSFLVASSAMSSFQFTTCVILILFCVFFGAGQSRFTTSSTNLASSLDEDQQFEADQGHSSLLRRREAQEEEVGDQLDEDDDDDLLLDHSTIESSTNFAVFDEEAVDELGDDDDDLELVPSIRRSEPQEVVTMPEDDKADFWYMQQEQEQRGLKVERKSRRKQRRRRLKGYVNGVVNEGCQSTFLESVGATGSLDMNSARRIPTVNFTGRSVEGFSNIELTIQVLTGFKNSTCDPATEPRPNPVVAYLNSDTARPFNLEVVEADYGTYTKYSTVVHTLPTDSLISGTNDIWIKPAVGKLRPLHAACVPYKQTRRRLTISTYVLLLISNSTR